LRAAEQIDRRGSSGRYHGPPLINLFEGLGWEGDKNGDNVVKF
jgi:hypothetical protein